jgi:hypothetical protein
MSELARWDSFFEIVGSAAGALIGLQFVVMTLIAQQPGMRSAEAGVAFGTPTIVHFSTVLFLSAAIQVPWPSVIIAATMWGVIGLFGVIYALVTMWRMVRQNSYHPDPDDWFFYALLPFAGYVSLAVSAFAARSDLHDALFGAGAAALLLLFVGIRNAWDSVMYHVFVTSAPPNDERR